MSNNRKGRTGAALAVTVAALASLALTSHASAQCVQCAMSQDRDPFTEGLVTPKQPDAVPSQTTRNAHAEMRGHRAHSEKNSSVSHR